MRLTGVGSRTGHDVGFVQVVQHVEEHQRSLGLGLPVRVARAQLDFLDDVGVNENNIKRVSEAAREFESALNIQQDKVAERDISVESRIEIGNQIYESLVLLCNIGKDIWAEKDVAKYENYTIYESNNDQKRARKEKLKKEGKEE